MRQLIIVLSTLCLVACSSKQTVPSDVLPEKKMQAVLWDILRAEEMTSYYKQRDSALNVFSKNIQLLDTIFSIHNITKKDFQKSIQFYQSHPQLLETVLDSLQKKSGLSRQLLQ